MTTEQKLKAYDETLKWLKLTEKTLLEIEGNGDLSESGCRRLNWTQEIVKRLTPSAGLPSCD